MRGGSRKRRNRWLRLLACPPEKRAADGDTYEEQQNVFHGHVLSGGSDNSTAAVRKTRPTTVRRIDLRNEKSSNEPPPTKHTVAMTFPTSTSAFARSLPSRSLNCLKAYPSIFVPLRRIGFLYPGGRTSHPLGCIVRRLRPPLSLSKNHARWSVGMLGCLCSSPSTGPF